jgi:hypothetical protein
MPPGRRANAASTKRRRRTGSGQCRGNPRAAGRPAVDSRRWEHQHLPIEVANHAEAQAKQPSQTSPARPVPVVDASISVPIADA